MRRLGVVMIPDAPPVNEIFGRNLGEDWVVPRDAIQVILVQEAAGGAVLTAFGPTGLLVAERFGPAFDPLARLLDDLHAAGAAAAPREIPAGAGSPRRWLLAGEGGPSA